MIHSNAKKVKLPTKNVQETNEELHTHTRSQGSSLPLLFLMRNIKGILQAKTKEF